MSESNLGKIPEICIAQMREIAEIERTIAHMEADVSFHHYQSRMFEKLLKEEQKKLEDLQSGTCSCCEDDNS